MAKTKISEFSSTAADNTDVTNINIAEGCSPANVNNAIRSLMALLKDQQTGASGDPFTVAGTLVASGQALSSGTLNVTGAFQLDGTAGASGQALVSAGGANTPTWSTLGTMASQSASAVSITGGTIENATITGGSITGITDLTVADGGTGASSITANSVILGNGTSALSGNLVAPSTSGNVLTSNGTTWTSVSKFTQGTAITASSSANILFTDIPSWVKRITLVGNDVVQSLAGDYAVQIGSGSLQTSGYLSHAASYGNNASGSTPTTASFNMRDLALTNSFIMTITRAYGNTYSAVHNIIGTSSSTSSGSGNGRVTLSGALDRINISITGGATLTGTFNILYE